MLFLLLAVVASASNTSWAPTSCGAANLITQWGKQVNPNSVLPEYPRPQLVRGSDSSWKNLNGIWQFQPASKGESPPFGKTLSGQILVPFPVESCLSGIGQNYQYLWYRLLFNRPFTAQNTILHFGAVDWQTTVYLNGQTLGNHTGGYDGFDFDITSRLQDSNNELILYVYDPSEQGAQPNGKQFISAIKGPGGDVYTPSSGIWQTVWLENVPSEHITALKIVTDTTKATITVTAPTAGATVNFVVTDPSGAQVATASGKTGTAQAITISSPKLWEPDTPNLYNVKISLASGDAITSYFGLRTFTLVNRGHAGSPATGVQTGIDRPGGDLSGYPITLSSADPNLCMNLCNNNTQCVAWAYAIPNCDSYTTPQCWLKGSSPATSNNKCRDSGAKATPSGTVKTPVLNGHGGAAATGPQTNIDRSGYDINGADGQPISTADPKACESLCGNTTGCTAWSYGVPNCGGSGSQPICWLKGAYPPTASNNCRVSGEMAKPLFLAGWLDQSWWPDGQYTAPTDDALAFDLQAAKDFGINVIRLHQKVNSERWYYHADRLGVLVFQDMVQKYGGASSATVTPFMNDLTAMVTGPRANHPSIVQWETFNEGDCWGVFDVPSVVNYVKSLDPVRPVDTDSGGGANDLHIGDVNDIHTYPYPGDPLPLSNQYAMLGEFGGIGAFVTGKEWVPGKCGTYLHVDTPQDEANTYLSMLQTISIHRSDISVSIYTQITDVELECDGFYNYDRTNKFTSATTQQIKQAHYNLIHA